MNRSDRAWLNYYVQDKCINNSNMLHVHVLQHSQMLIVRKEGKAHDRYNSFRSAFELLEAVGREPHDHFQEKADDLPPLETLEKKVVMQNAEIAELKQQIKSMQQRIQQQKQSFQQQMQSMQQQIQEIRSQNNFIVQV